MSEQIVDGHSRQVWWNADGETVVESYTIADMAHGIPLAPSEGGVVGPFMIEAGISSSDHIATFFGLTKTPAESTTSQRPVPILGGLRKATRPHRIRAVRAWRDISAIITRALIVVGLTERSVSDQL
jgi:hypothetical protein